MAATIAGFAVYREHRPTLPQGDLGGDEIAGKKKPDLAKAFNRATALRSNKCKGRFVARKALKGLRQVT
jgi:hypothetical protein